MGINNETEIEVINLTRRIVMFNSHTIFNIKNSLMLMTEQSWKQQQSDYDKFCTILKNNYPKTDPELVLANPVKNINHNLTKLDMDLIKNIILESINSETVTSETVTSETVTSETCNDKN